jgi:hypothetical protein
MASSVASTSGRCLVGMSAPGVNSGRMDSNRFTSCSSGPLIARQTQSVSGSWESSFRGTGVSSLCPVSAEFVKGPKASRREITMMGNKNAGKGIFAPVVVVTRNIVGVKQFNQLRGKGIALHSQVRFSQVLLLAFCSDNLLVEGQAIRSVIQCRSIKYLKMQI